MGKLDDRSFEGLLAFLERVPSIEGIAHGSEDDSSWWVKFRIDINHKFAWHVVQEFGFVLNYVSIDERLPTVFKPVSPPPYMNGGPDDFLSWVVEAYSSDFRPGTCAKWLESRLPNPVDDPTQWGDGED